LPASRLPQSGMWGGLIVLGKAPIIGGTKNIEGLPADGPKSAYGGSVAADDSGTLEFVRVWMGGRDINPPTREHPENSGNEINGITLGGVGSKTKVENCEVAFNKDDGFEMFGGTVNLKRCSAIFVGDDAFDTDEGYQGKMQFLFCLVGAGGHHCTEMDSKMDKQPRSFPQMYGATFIGGGPNNIKGQDAIMRLREGTGGEFVNLVLAQGSDKGMKINTCGTELISQVNPIGDEYRRGRLLQPEEATDLTNPSAKPSQPKEDPAVTARKAEEAKIRAKMTAPDYLFISKENIIHTEAKHASTSFEQFNVDGSCYFDEESKKTTPVAVDVNPGMVAAPDTVDLATLMELAPANNIKRCFSIRCGFDPRPDCRGEMYRRKIVELKDTSFFDNVVYTGAFSWKEEEFWLRGLSWLDESGMLADGLDKSQDNCVKVVDSSVEERKRKPTPPADVTSVISTLDDGTLAAASTTQLSMMLVTGVVGTAMAVLSFNL